MHRYNLFEFVIPEKSGIHVYSKEPVLRSLREHAKAKLMKQSKAIIVIFFFVSIPFSPP